MWDNTWPHLVTPYDTYNFPIAILVTFLDYKYATHAQIFSTFLKGSRAQEVWPKNLVLARREEKYSFAKIAPFTTLEQLHWEQNPTLSMDDTVQNKMDYRVHYIIRQLHGNRR